MLARPRRQQVLDWLFLLLQSTSQFHQRDVLELADALARDAEFLTDFFERLRLSAIEAEAGEDDLFLALI